VDSPYNESQHDYFNTDGSQSEGDNDQPKAHPLKRIRIRCDPNNPDITDMQFEPRNDQNKRGKKRKAPKARSKPIGRRNPSRKAREATRMKSYLSEFRHDGLEIDKDKLSAYLATQHDLSANADDTPNEFHPIQGMVAKQAKTNPNILTSPR